MRVGKHGLRNLAKTATLRLQKLKKRATLAAWRAAQHKVKRKRELLRKAGGFVPPCCDSCCILGMAATCLQVAQLEAHGCVGCSEDAERQEASCICRLAMQGSKGHTENGKCYAKLWPSSKMSCCLSHLTHAHIKHSVRCFNIRRQNAQRHGVLRGWHAAQQRATYKTEMLRSAAAFFSECCVAHVIPCVASRQP